MNGKNGLRAVAVICLLAVSALLQGAVPRAVWAGARNPCLEAGNLTFNCGFDTFVERTHGTKQLNVPDGWWFFIVAGDPDFRLSTDTYWDYPSLWLVSDGMPFTAGVYQQVPVTAGVVYQTDIGWAAPSTSDFERRLGLDPSGGTDPLAATVSWGRSETGMTRWPDLSLSARATGPTMTVFVWVAHTVSHGGDSIYLDAVGLWPDPNQPAATPTDTPSPVPTRRLPPNTPTALPPTATQTVLPFTPTMTSTPAPTPTETPLPTAAPTATATPTTVPATATPTLTPTRTPVLVVVRVGATPEIALGHAAAPVTARLKRSSKAAPYLYVAGAALVGAAVLGAAVLCLWLGGQRPSGGQKHS